MSMLQQLSPDGEEFGMGAEIGISTQKLHAHGPIVPELTTINGLSRSNWSDALIIFSRDCADSAACLTSDNASSSVVVRQFL